MYLAMKKCIGPKCNRWLPSSYFDDTCPDHQTLLGQTLAEQKANDMFLDDGREGLIVNAFSPLIPDGKEILILGRLS